jgi:hypothetical protein
MDPGTLVPVPCPFDAALGQKWAKIRLSPNCVSSASVFFKFRSFDRAVGLLHLDVLSTDFISDKLVNELCSKVLPSFLVFILSGRQVIAYWGLDLEPLQRQQTNLIF